MPPRSRPVVHLELHTGDVPGASAFYSELCGGGRRNSNDICRYDTACFDRSS